MNLIDELLEMTSEIETPASFIKFAGYAAISSILKRKVYLNKFAYKLYPNLYILLVADSGLAKGYANVVARKLVESVKDVKVISGRNSIQGIIRTLSTVSSNGTMHKDASCFLNSGEFINFLIQDSQAITILIDLYDSIYHDNYENTLKSTGKETLKDPYVVLLGASNEILLKEAIPESSVEGGFIARTILVCEEKKRVINPLTRAPKRDIDFTQFKSYLSEVSKLKGEFTYTSEARDFYEEWYSEFAQRTQVDRTRSSNRLHDSVLKLAIVISASRRLDQKLEKSDIEDALEEITIAKSKEKGIFFTKKSNSDWAIKSRAVADSIVKAYTTGAGRISRIKILQSNYGIVNAEDLDKVLENMNQAKYLITEREDKEIYYRLSPAAIKEIQD